MKPSFRSFLVAGERRRAAFLADPSAAVSEADVDFHYAIAEDAPADWVSLGPAPWIQRPLRLGHLSSRLPNVPLLLPFGRKPRAGFRELTTADPRMSRLWGRFSVDVPVAMERDAKLVGERVFDRPDEGYRVFIMEDGDRYAIRAMCIFVVREGTGYVIELLHDRTLEGMRDASHVLGLALRAMTDAGATVARAAALARSGTMPLFLRHAFVGARADAHLMVRPVDPALADLVGDRERWYLSYLDLEDA